MKNYETIRIVRQEEKLTRDLTQVAPRAKSEVRQRINTFLAEERQRIKKLITDEIAVAHTEGDRTSRLTSLYMKI